MQENPQGEYIVSRDATINYRSITSGVLANVYSFLGIQIYNQNLEPIYFIQPDQITQIGLGSYASVIPGIYLITPGIYHAQWQVVPVQGESTFYRNYPVIVVNQFTQPRFNTYKALNMSLDTLTAAFVKQYYLWPVWTVLANGYYLPDREIQSHIDNAITWAQRVIGIPLKQTRVLTFPYGDDQSPPNPVLGEDYDEPGELLQWSAVESLQWSSLRLPHTGIIRVRGIRGIYGGRVVYRIPTDWVARNELKMGLIRIRPTTTGSIANIVDNSGRFLDVTLLESIGSTFVPGFWAVDYDYGQVNSVFPKEIGDVICKKAACLLLDQLGQAISKGLSSRSASADGISSSLNYVANAERSMFGALAKRYEADLEEDKLIDMRRYYRGPSCFIF